MPPYPDFGENDPRVDITDRLDDVLTVTSGGMAGSMLALEQLLLEESKQNHQARTDLAARERPQRDAEESRWLSEVRCRAESALTSVEPREVAFGPWNDRARNRCL